MKNVSIKFAALAMISLMLIGCGKDKKSTNPQNNNSSLRFVGTVNGADGIMSGSVVFSISDTAVTGTFKVVTPDTATHSLTGMYNIANKVLSATGAGYNFGGMYDGNNELEGAMTGNTVGTFLTVRDDASQAVAFCGTFSGDDDGLWNFTIDGTTIAGSYTVIGGMTGLLAGSVSGNNINITTPSGDPLASGTRNGDNASGTWDDGNGNSGSWIGYRSN